MDRYFFRFRLAGIALLIALLSALATDAQDDAVYDPTLLISSAIQDAEEIPDTLDATETDEGETLLAAWLNWQPPIPSLSPTRAETVAPSPSPVLGLTGNLLGGLYLERASTPGGLYISGDEARGRVSSDAGNLLGKSPNAISVGVQRRNPIIYEPRVRGSRVGSLAARGSYWIPARIDLDTMLSKIDSRLLDHIDVVPGPYDVFNGPGLQTIHFELLAAPRYEYGGELHGRTSLNYMHNGQHVYGRQDFWGGNEDWGVRGGYGHRTGNDYVTGAGAQTPASFNSRDVHLTLGRDFAPDEHVEFTYLRLDQTGVELPGQAFNIDDLATDSYELRYWIDDLVEMNAWYNRTRFNGDARNKERQFPFLQQISFVGRTDVDATSTGYRLSGTWDDGCGSQLALGTDLRFVNQELNEIISAQTNVVVIDRNSPIPDSDWINPGIFLRQKSCVSDCWSVEIGARADFVNTRIVDDPAKLAAVGTLVPPGSYADIVGTDIQDRGFKLWAAYLSTGWEPVEGWSLTFQAGHAERAPSLTELYVAQSFMFLLQNGLNTVTGDPRLATEKLWQLDLILARQGERWNARLRGFHSWINDYITFENLDVVDDFGPVDQVNLKYVNTDLATLAGFEFLTEYHYTDRLTPFATLQYVCGQDRTRNGDFATLQAQPGAPSVRFPGRSRGFFSGVAGAASEPLPQISPLQSRMGIRLHDAAYDPWWTVEISARLVAAQDRVAASLLEQPTRGFVTGDIRAVVRPTDAWVLVGGIENFTDTNYQEHLDFHPQPGSFSLPVFQPGINAYVGAELSY